MEGIISHHLLRSLRSSVFVVPIIPSAKKHSLSEEASSGVEPTELYKDLKKRIEEFKIQLVKNKRHTFLSRSAKQSLVKLERAVIEMKHTVKSVDGEQLTSSVPSSVTLEATVWDNFGGLNSFLMSTEGKGEAVRIHSPVGIRQYFDCVRPFASNDIGFVKYPVQVEERSLEDVCYSDPAMKVHYLPLMPSSTNSPPPAGNSPPRHSSLRPVLRTDIAFLVQLTKPPRRIDVARLVKLGIPNGPHIAKLKNGHEVNLDGRLIKPDDVLFPEESGEEPSILILECSSTAYMSSLRECSLLQDFISKTKTLTYCVHFTRKEVLQTAEYSEWMSSLGESCKHIILNGTGPALPHLEGAHKQQGLLRSIAPFFFHALKPEFEGLITQDDECERQGNSYFARPFQRFILRGNSHSSNGIFNNLINVSYKDCDMTEEATSEIEKFRKASEGIDENEDAPAVLFLGTSSATSSKYRNVSGHLLKASEDSYILVDCGEGTYGNFQNFRRIINGQMRVYFGDDKCAEMLLNLHAAFLTHSHTDHVMGLYSVLLKRKAAFVAKGLPFRPLLVVCCPSVMKALNVYSYAFSDLSPLVVFLNPFKATIAANRQKLRQPQLQSIINMNMTVDLIPLLPRPLFDEKKWGVQGISAVQRLQVHHTRMARGYIFELASGHKVVFSGDTKPCQLLAEKGINADLLVHEATFEDGLEKDALSKKHSTMRQAVDIGRQMRAKHIILNHFSCRYAKVPSLPGYLDEFGNIAVAVDNLFVSFKNLSMLPKLIPVYRELFKDELFEIGVKLDQQLLKERQQAEELKTKNLQVLNSEGRSSSNVTGCKRKASSELQL
ncbi:unnamed protein product [Enterobius vermicularis]|uniref:ribonuclease Z n=1 Tax=Enterobius vermicularis TaxID=51028 RepID=A0A158Q9N3_ENTVE|nr:unnamed protein product [Enterobius vermicularis]